MQAAPTQQGSRRTCSMYFPEYGTNFARFRMTSPKKLAFSADGCGGSKTLQIPIQQTSAVQTRTSTPADWPSGSRQGEQTSGPIAVRWYWKWRSISAATDAATAGFHLECWHVSPDASTPPEPPHPSCHAATPNEYGSWMQSWTLTDIHAKMDSHIWLLAQVLADAFSLNDLDGNGRSGTFHHSLQIANGLCYWHNPQPCCRKR
eukprot:3011837-Rhodomonas_salina.4